MTLAPRCDEGHWGEADDAHVNDDIGAGVVVGTTHEVGREDAESLSEKPSPL